MERLTDKNHNAVNSCGEYSSCYSCNREKCYISELADKLGEFEDFMEEQGFEDLDTFRTAIKLNQLMNKAGVEHFKENQALKARWEKLREYIFSTKPLVGKSVCFLKETLLGKMQELEE